MFISIRHGERDAGAGVLHHLPGEIGHPRHVDEQVVGTEPDGAFTFADGVELRGHAEAADDVRGDGDIELAPEIPGSCVEARGLKVDLAAHEHGHELVARREVLLLDAACVVRIRRTRRRSLQIGPRALEITEDDPSLGVGAAFDRSVGVPGRVVDLRDVVRRRDARVELAERAEQLADVDVLRPVHRGERAQDVLEIIDRAVRLAVVEQQPVGEEAA